MLVTPENSAIFRRFDTGLPMGLGFVSS